MALWWPPFGASARSLEIAGSSEFLANYIWNNAAEPPGLHVTISPHPFRAIPPILPCRHLPTSAALDIPVIDPCDVHFRHGDLIAQPR